MTITGGTYKLTLKNPQIGFWLCLYSTKLSPGTVSPQLRRVHTVDVSTRLWPHIFVIPFQVLTGLFLVEVLKYDQPLCWVLNS